MGENTLESNAPGKPQEAFRRLTEFFGNTGGALVAFSGGVDSSLVLAAARQALGARALAVTACSPTYPDHEKDQAATIAQRLGARHEFIDSDEFEDPSYRANPPNRCYYCKQELFRKLKAVAAREGLPVVVDGSNADDELDFRPGHKAAKEFGVRSPLAELGFGKNLIRQIAKAQGLPNWNQPACACLASRIPYGQEITPLRLRRVAQAEAAIRDVGFRTVRVRDHGMLARIEIPREEIDRALGVGVQQRLIDACKLQGYVYVCLDLEGYRTGSMNEVLGSSGKTEILPGMIRSNPEPDRQH
ncbi:MAG: ATP-dependent sacrificial sulfur transferase LarE [Hyphomicrobiales bacterium]